MFLKDNGRNNKFMKQNQPIKLKEKTDAPSDATSDDKSDAVYIEEELSGRVNISRAENTKQANEKPSIDGAQKMVGKRNYSVMELPELLKQLPKRSLRYTTVGSEAIENRIKSDMLFIRNYIQDHFDAKKIYAIILGGSYGAGDGGVKIESGVERPFHDYDFFVFFKNKSFVEYKNADVFFRSAGSILTKKLGITVDFSCVYHKDYLNNLPLSLRWYDLQMGHKVLIGDANALISRKMIDPAHFPIQEAFQLILNRGVGALEAKRSLKQKSYNALKINMLLYKAILALGDGFLIAKGSYRSNMLLRYEILKRHALSVDLINELLPYYKKAIDFRLRPIADHDHKKIELLLSKVLYFFRKFYLSLFSLYYGKNLRDFVHLANMIIKDPIVDYRGQSTVKNILINLSSFGLSNIFSKWVTSYPANRLFAVLPFFLFDMEVNRFLLHYIDKALMLEDSGFKSGMHGKRYEKFISIWSRFN